MKRDRSNSRHRTIVLAALAATLIFAASTTAGECPPGSKYCYGPRYQAPGYQAARYHAPISGKPYGAPAYGDQAPGYYADIKVLDIRWIDAGIPEKKLGPAYRVVLRNIGRRALYKFDVVLTAGVGPKLAPELPAAVTTIDRLYPGQSLAVDLRLPNESLAMAIPGQDAPVPFDTLTILTTLAPKDAQPLAVVPRDGILPVDLALAPLDSYTIPAGATLRLAGEGFTYEPGNVVVQVGGLSLAAKVLHWDPSGVEVKLPHLPLARLTPARLFVTRNDRMTSRPLTFELDQPVAVAGPVVEPIGEPNIEPAAAAIAEPVDEPVDETPIEATTEAIDAPAVEETPDALEATPVEDTPEVDAGASAPATGEASPSIVSRLTRLFGR